MKLSLKTKVICAVLFMALALALTAGLISYNVYSRSMERHYEELTFNTAKSAASMLDADAIAGLAARTLEIYLSRRRLTLTRLTNPTGLNTMRHTMRSHLHPNTNRRLRR